MSLLKCPKCGEMFSDSYKSCPFCAEDDAYFDGGVKPKARKKGAGRRVEGHDRGPNILGPALIVVVLLLAAVLIYSFFGDKISAWIHRNDPKPVEITLAVEPVSAELSVGEIRALSANGVEEVLWSSSDEAVATVDEKGNVTAIGAGTATITATHEASKLTAQCEVTVTDPGQTVDPGPAPNPEPTPGPEPTPNPEPTPTKKLAIGAAWSGQALPMIGSQYDCTLSSGSDQLIVVGTDSKVTWTSSDPSKVTVDEDGVITRLISGTVIITAEVDGQKMECRVLG